MDVLIAALDDRGEDGIPTRHAIDSARYILDQVYGKARRSVDVAASGSFEDWLKKEKPDDPEGL